MKKTFPKAEQDLRDKAKFESTYEDRLLKKVKRFARRGKSFVAPKKPSEPHITGKGWTPSIPSNLTNKMRFLQRKADRERRK